jgi:hypothetical protein
MISAKVRSIDLSGVIAKAPLAERRIKVQLTQVIREDTKPYVPYQDGALRQSAETNSIPDKGMLIYGGGSVPYARVQYYGLPNKTWPGTVGQWYEYAKAANLPRWLQIAQKEAESA